MDRNPALRRRVVLPVVGVMLLLVLAALAGCATRNPFPVGSFERGQFFSEKGKDLEAVSAFESFVRRSPTDSLAAEAQYLKAMAYMEMREYPLAAVELQILRKDYPTSNFVEDALFEEGKAYLFQVDRVERDVTGAHEARLHFLNFSQQYPSSHYMPEVTEYMQQISDLMVKKRLQQVQVYRQLKRYGAIAIVLDDVLANEAASTLLPRVLFERGRVAQRLSDNETATGMFKRLIDEYPQSDYAARAGSLLGEAAARAETETDS